MPLQHSQREKIESVHAIEYFKILFLDILSRESGKIVVSYKHKLDKIKLRKNRLKSLLKLKYEFSLDIDDYNRYVRDDTWTQVVKKLEEIYADSDEMAKKLTKPFYILISCSTEIMHQKTCRL